MRILLFVILLLCPLPVLAQQVIMEAELAPPAYSTLAQSGGVRWVAYGRLYPVGTFANLPQCASAPEGVEAIGGYKIAGEWGNASLHSATYRLTFGKANDGKQFVFSGIIETGEVGQPEMKFATVRMVNGRLEEGWEVELTQKASQCFGGTVRVIALP